MNQKIKYIVQHYRSEILKYNSLQKNSRWETLKKEQKMWLYCDPGRSKWNDSFFNNGPWSQLMTEDVKMKTLFVPGSRNMKLFPMQLKRKGKNLKHQTLN